MATNQTVRFNLSDCHLGPLSEKLGSPFIDYQELFTRLHSGTFFQSVRLTDCRSGYLELFIRLFGIFIRFMEVVTPKYEGAPVYLGVLPYIKIGVD